MKYRYHVHVAPGLDYDSIGDENLHLKKGDAVIVRCDRYQDFGIISACYEDAPVDEKDLDNANREKSAGRRIEGQRVPRILRRATLVDKSKAHENEARANSMHRTACKRIQEHGLNMKLINTHCAFDRRLIVFQFTAEGRVDFRELLRDLSQELHNRVELRQVGVRDEAAIQGGIGPCGRAFCCSTFLKSFVSINVRMAKEQRLSLNPSNISGACGRLKCCLNYETDWYRENRKAEAHVGQRCDSPMGPGKVVAWNEVDAKLDVSLDDKGGEIATFALDELSIENEQQNARCCSSHCGRDSA